MRWGRSLNSGDKVRLQAGKPIAAVVKQVRPWRERTQVLLSIDDSGHSAPTVGQRLHLRMPAPSDDKSPSGLGKIRDKAERVEWLIASFYCPCLMHDDCAGHFLTVTACNAGCGMATGLRKNVVGMIDKGLTDVQIIDDLLKTHGPKLLRPHMQP
jgi:hypothetical protein